MEEQKEWGFYWTGSFIFSLSAFGGASELLELELEELELLASLVLELEAFGVTEIGVGT